MNCPNCDHPTNTESILGYYLCNLCGIRFLPTDIDISEYYSSGEYRGRIRQTDEYKHQKRRAHHIIQYVGHPKVFIDIGCSMGILMNEVRKTGAECYGVDLDPVFTGDVFSKLSDVPKQADCITLIHSLEHMLRPLDYLKEVYNKLDAGGRVVIEVPNGDVNESGEYYRAVFKFPHLVMFDRKSLEWTMRAAGFEVEQVVIHGTGGVVNAPDYYYLLMTGVKPFAQK